MNDPSLVARIWDWFWAVVSNWKGLVAGLSLAIAFMAHCPRRERSDDTLSGTWRVKGTRVPVQGILDNAEDLTAEQIAREIYDLPVDVVRRILTFAGRR
jgi:uncharacterized protein (DUF433 family)